MEGAPEYGCSDDTMSDQSEVQSALREHPVDLTKPLTLSEIASLKRMLDADHDEDEPCQGNRARGCIHDAGHVVSHEHSR